MFTLCGDGDIMALDRVRFARPFRSRSGRVPCSFQMINQRGNVAGRGRVSIKILVIICPPAKEGPRATDLRGSSSRSTWS
jgi:hypothetical protein